MLTARGMRWGYDGGGMACGPVEGNTLVELCVTAEDHRNYFILFSRMGEYARITVSGVPLFDVWMYSNCDGVDVAAEAEKCSAGSLEDYEYEMGGTPGEEMGRSRFAKGIHLVRLAMEEAYGCDDEMIPAKAAEFMEAYAGEDLDEMELPELEEEPVIDDEFWDEDDGEDEEEEEEDRDGDM